MLGYCNGPHCRHFEGGAAAPDRVWCCRCSYDTDQEPSIQQEASRSLTERTKREERLPGQLEWPECR